MARAEVGHVALRAYSEGDAAAVASLARAGFEEFRPAYADWPAMSASISQMPALAGAGELILAELAGALVGAVAYIGPDRAKASFFEPRWPIVRMLVVHPVARGKGVGRALMEECCRRPRRDRSPVLALHTSPIMTTALAMYQDMGFVRQSDGPSISGVQSAVDVLAL